MISSIDDKIAGLNIKKNHTQIDLEFFGAIYQPERDKKRLTTQLLKILNFMSDQKWHTLSEIEEATGAPQASASAALRALRNPKNGGYVVERKRSQIKCSGVHYYRLGAKRGEDVV